MNKEKYRILNAIMRGVWFIEPVSALNSYPIVQAFMDKDEPDEKEEKEPEPKLIAFSLNDGALKPVMGFSFDEVPKGSVAIIPVRGSLMKEDFCGEPGMRTLGKMVQDADQHDNIIGIVKWHDSPGGTADGTEEFAQTTLNTRKPIVSWVDGMSASASYWPASQSNYVMLSGKTAGVGSVGTMLSIHDVRGMWEKYGVKQHTVIADQTPDKNKDWLEMLDGKYDLVKKNLLNPNAQAFIDSVKAARPGIQEEGVKGGFYLGQKAIDLGMADGFGTLEDAVKKVQELSNGESSSQPSNNQNSNMFPSKLDKAVKNLAAKVKGGEEITMEDVTPINTELANQGLEGFVIATKAGLDKNEKAIEDAQNKLATVTAERDKLAKNPGATHTDPGAGKKGADGGDTTDPTVVTETQEFSSYAHNIEALKEIENL